MKFLVDVTVFYADGEAGDHDVAVTAENADAAASAAVAQLAERFGRPAEDVCVNRVTVPHTGHYSRIGGTYWCDTCDSPYCELA